MKVGDLVEAHRCRRPGEYCGCIFCDRKCSSRLGLVIDREIVGTAKNSLYTVQFGFGPWRVYDTGVNIVSKQKST